MIQRIQTLWLIIAAALAVLSFKFGFYTGAPVNGGGIQSLNASSYIPILIVTIATIALSLITIFMYKSRGKQLFLTILDLLAGIGLIYLYYYEIHSNFVGGTLALSAILVILVPVFLLLAIRGIYRDMRLLKKADRLRK